MRRVRRWFPARLHDLVDDGVFEDAFELRGFPHFRQEFGILALFLADDEACVR